MSFKLLHGSCCIFPVRLCFTIGYGLARLLFCTLVPLWHSTNKIGSQDSSSKRNAHGIFVNSSLDEGPSIVSCACVGLPYFSLLCPSMSTSF